MALTRSTKANFPCRHCLIASKDQVTYPPVHAQLRTTTDTVKTVERARGRDLLKDKETDLQSKGLRDVDVRPVFSFVPLLSLTTCPTECVLENQKLRPVSIVV